MSLAVNFENQIFLDILSSIQQGGLTIGRWALNEDPLGDFRIGDLTKKGYYRFPKTS